MCVFCHTDPGLPLLCAKFIAFLQHFPREGRHNEGFLSSKRERACKRVRPWNHSRRAAAVCLLAAVSPSGCFGRKEGSEDGKREG